MLKSNINAKIYKYSLIKLSVDLRNLEKNSLEN